MTRLLRSVAVAVLAVALFVLPASPVGAHAELIRSTPLIDGLVTTDLDAVQLTFTPLAEGEPFSIDVVDPEGNSVTKEDAVRIDQRTLAVPIELSTLGVHTVTYAVVGIDLDPTEESFTFTVEKAAGTSSLPIIILWVLALAVVAAFFLRRPKKAGAAPNKSKPKKKK